MNGFATGSTAIKSKFKCLLEAYRLYSSCYVNVFVSMGTLKNDYRIPKYSMWNQIDIIYYKAYLAVLISVYCLHEN